jgi:hypothetical protein
VATIVAHIAHKLNLGGKAWVCGMLTMAVRRLIIAARTNFLEQAMQ